MAIYSQIQHPRPKGEKPFQELCLKLLRLEWNDPLATLHGRSGQGQQGVDISGTDRRGTFGVVGCQCKGSEKHQGRIPTIKELLDEIEEAKKYTPPLGLLIFAYAGDRDGPLQAKAREVTEAHRAVGLFEVHVWSWDDIVDRAEPYPEMRKDMYIQDEYIELVLDPKRPQANPLSDSPALGAVINTSSRLALVETSAAAAPADALAEARIDVLRDQIRAGNGGTVIEALRKLLGELDAEASPHVRFRIHANLGAALEQVGLKEEANEEFERAADAEAGTADSHAYRARAFLGQNMRAQAYDAASAALEINGDQRLAAVVLIDSAEKGVATSALERRVSGLTHFPDIASTLAGRYADEGEHDDALRVARAMDEGDAPVQKLVTIAQVILQRLEKSLDVRMGLPISNEDHALLSEARASLERSWEFAKQRPDRKNWLFVAANLVAAYRFTGNDTAADDLALEAYALDSSNPHLMERAVVALVHRGDSKTALEISAKLAEQGADRGALLAADMSVMASDWPALLKWASKAYGEAGSAADLARAAERIIMAFHRLEGPTAALAKADELRAEFPSDVAFEARVAEIARRSGDIVAIRAAKERLADFDWTELDSMERFELANAYADEQEWTTAAELLDGLYSLDRPSEPLRQRLLYLYRGDQLSRARELFESLSGDALKSKEVLRLGAAIYEKAGMLPAALRALEAALDLSPADLGSRLDWARLRIRNSDEARVRKWFASANLNVSGEPEEVLEFAQLLDRYERRADALALGYQTLRRHWGESERVHLLYMSLFLMHPRIDPNFVPGEVTIDTVAFLQNKRTGELSDYRIEESATGPGALRPEQRFAQLILGKKVGDTVEVADGIGQPETWTILEIKHKYLDLFHRALESHDQTFPGSRAIGRFNIEPEREGGFEPLFEQARQRARTVEEAVRIYKENLVPVDTIAKVLGLNVIDAARGIRFQSGVALDSCVGGGPEREQALIQLSKVTDVLVDPLTLSVWQEIELLAPISAIPDLKIHVVQATIDLLMERVEDAAVNAQQEGGSLQAHGDQIAFIEPTQYERNAYVETCQALLDWVKANANVLPTEPLANAGQADEILSASSIANLGTLIAVRMPAVLEDRRFRMLAASHGIAKLGWTQAFLLALRMEGRFSHSDYARYSARLHRSKIGFISVSADDLLASVLSGDAEDVGSLIETLSVPTVEIPSLVNVIASFITLLWSTPEHRDRREKLTSASLEVLLVKPDGIELTRLALVEANRAIRRLRFPMSLTAKWWWEYVERFLKGHFVFDAFTGGRGK